MTMEQVQKIKINNKYKILNLVFKKYHLAQNLFKQKKLIVNNQNIKLLELYALVDSILNIMSIESRKIVNNLFVKKNKKNLKKDLFLHFSYYQVKKAINTLCFYLLV